MKYDESITADLVHDIASLFRVLAGRDLTPPSVQKSLLDLLHDKDFNAVLFAIHLPGVKTDAFREAVLRSGIVIATSEVGHGKTE